MPKFRMLGGGNHVDKDQLWNGVRGNRGVVIESDKPLDEMFANKFEKAGGDAQATSAEFFQTADAPIRRTAASEAQNLQKPNAGHEVPVGSTPDREVDVENATAAEKVEEQVDGEFFDPDFENPTFGTTLTTPTKTKASRKGSTASASKAPSRASKASSQEGEGEGSEEDDDAGEGDDEPSDVTEDFSDAGAANVTVQKEGKTYFLLNENGNKVGERGGYTSKAAVNAELKSRVK